MEIANESDERSEDNSAEGGVHPSAEEFGDAAEAEEEKDGGDEDDPVFQEYVQMVFAAFLRSHGQSMGDIHKYEDDVNAIARRDPRFKIPKNFSHEIIPANTCSDCDFSHEKHKRSRCCRSFRKEHHTGVLEFISWDFEPFRIQKAPRERGNVDNEATISMMTKMTMMNLHVI